MQLATHAIEEKVYWYLNFPQPQWRKAWVDLLGIGMSGALETGFLVLAAHCVHIGVLFARTAGTVYLGKMHIYISTSCT